MNMLQIFLVALFIYLGSIGSIVGNTIGWYTLGRPLVASFIVGLVMGDLQTAMIVGIPLQIMLHGILPMQPTLAQQLHLSLAKV